MREMKDSGFSWLGDIPVSWKMQKVKHCFYRKNEKAMQDDPVVLSLARSGVKVRDISNNEGQLAESYYNYNPVAVGDLLLNPMDLYSGANCSISKVQGVISPAYVNLKAFEGINPAFFDYYFKVQYWLMAFFSYGKGVSFDNRWTLSTETLMNYPVIVPSYDEQCHIADYLDEKCGRIDTIIANQECIVEKLSSYKTSYLNEVIIDAPTETTCHIGFLGKMKNGLNYSNTEEGQKVKFLGVGDFKDYYCLDDSEMFSTIHLAEEIDSDYYLKDGDIVFVRSNGSKDLVGRAIMVDNINVPVTYSGFCIRFRNIRQDVIDSRFLLYFFRTPYFRKQLEKYSYGSNINNMNQDLLSQISISFPNKREQEKIVGKIESKTQAIDCAIENRKQIIDKLQEYKKSLIYEVVTGKKEVC